MASQPAPAASEGLTVVATNGAANSAASGNGSAKGNGLATLGGTFGGGAKVAFATQADAPSCAECGSIMVRNGSCYKCLNCGSTSGCS
jgi:ribonucleoside-diphosphate reductase alpha chain